MVETGRKMPVSCVMNVMKIPILMDHPGISRLRNFRWQRELKQKDVPVIVANVLKSIVIHRGQAVYVLSSYSITLLHSYSSGYAA